MREAYKIITVDSKQTAEIFNAKSCSVYVFITTML